MENLLSLFSTLKSSLNWLDFVIAGVFIFYFLEGFGVGFIVSFFDLASFVSSFVLGLKFYNVLGKILFETFSLPHGISNALGFFIIAALAETILIIIFRKTSTFLQRFCKPRDEEEKPGLILAWFKTLNHFFGIFPALASSFVLLSFLLALIISLPLSPVLKKTIYSSKFGNYFVSNTQSLEKTLNNVFGKAINETLNFLTIEPKSNEFVNLNFRLTSFSVDKSSEEQMFLMVNKERTSWGISPLVFDERLRDVARKHAEDMFLRGYFSHNSPEGVTPFDRMAQAGISFTYAGENLALAPNVDLAIQGLMQSEGHRANMLSPNFGRIGIGVADGGIYGEMFVQEFTN